MFGVLWTKICSCSWFFRIKVASRGESIFRLNSCQGSAILYFRLSSWRCSIKLLLFYHFLFVDIVESVINILIILLRCNQNRLLVYLRLQRALVLGFILLILLKCFLSLVYLILKFFLIVVKFVEIAFTNWFRFGLRLESAFLQFLLLFLFSHQP